MREAERLREKQQFPPGGRRAAFALCALVLLGGVFSLGVLIGRKTTSAQAPAAAPGDLAALDAEARRPAAPAAKPAPAARPVPPAEPPAPDPAPAHAAASPEPVRAATIVPAPVRSAAVIPPPPARPTKVSAPATLTPPPRELGAFTVQVGASQDREEAARLEGRVRSAGLRPYVVQAHLGSKGSWYRIRVGAFRDKDSANRFRKDVERELRLAAVVMPTH